MPAVFGTVSPEIFLYDSNSSVFESFCLSNVAPCQRIKICFDMDVDSYNSNAEGEGLSGQFFDYLQGITVQIADSLPAQPSDLVLANDPFLGFSFNSNFSGGCMEFRISEDWSDSLKYVLITYKFKINTVLPAYCDYITIPFRLLVNSNTAQITGELQDAGGTPLDRLCDTEDEAQICFTETLPGDYDFFPVIDINGAIEEENGYLNTNFESLDSELVNSTENDFLDGDACLTIDSKILPIDEEVCVKAIAIQNPISTLTGSCPCLDFSSTSAIQIATLDTVRVKITYSVIGATNYQSIQVSVPIETSVGPGIANFDLGTNNIGSFEFLHFSASDPVDLTYTWNVTLDDGCQYTEVISHSNTRLTGNQELLASQNCGSRGNCSVALAVANQACDYSIEISNTSISHVPRANTNLVDIEYTYDLINDCVSPTIPISSTTNTVSVNGGNLGYGFGSIYGGTDFSLGGYIDTIRVSSYLTGVISSTDINVSAVTYDGVNQAAYATALQGEIETQITAWNGAVNNVDYTLTVFMFSNNVLILFDNRHQPAGLWVGVDRTNEASTSFPDGVTSESGSLNGTTIAASFCGSYAIPCGTLAIAKSCQNMIVSLSYGNFYEIVINPGVTIFTFADGSSGTFDGCGAITLNFDETCNTDIITATPVDTTGIVTYSWTFNGTDLGINAASIDSQGAGDYVVTITDQAGCLASETITI